MPVIYDNLGLTYEILTKETKANSPSCLKAGVDEHKFEMMGHVSDKGPHLNATYNVQCELPLRHLFLLLGNGANETVYLCLDIAAKGTALPWEVVRGGKPVKKIEVEPIPRKTSVKFSGALKNANFPFVEFKLEPITSPAKSSAAPSPTSDTVKVIIHGEVVTNSKDERLVAWKQKRRKSTDHNLLEPGQVKIKSRLDIHLPCAK